jgi:hypothetical protein
MPSLRPNSKPCRVTAATSTSRGNDFITDHGDDPNLQYVHVLSAAMQSPMSYSQHGDANIDALFERQKRALDPAERKRATREFEQYAIGPGLQHHAVLVAAHCRTQQTRQGLAAYAQPLPRQ